jgi:hypothetical protein
MIDWGDAAHPTDTLRPAVRLLGLDVFTPDAKRLRTALDIVGVVSDVEVHDSDAAGLRARIETSKGVTLSS